MAAGMITRSRRIGMSRVVGFGFRVLVAVAARAPFFAIEFLSLGQVCLLVHLEQLIERFSDLYPLGWGEFLYSLYDFLCRHWMFLGLRWVGGCRGGWLSASGDEG